MSNEKHLILKTPKFSYELSQFIKVESIDNNMPYNDIIVKYLNFGIEKDDFQKTRILKIPSELDILKTVYISDESDKFLLKKTNENKISKNNLFINYIVSGIEHTNNKSTLQQYWFDLLKEDLVNVYVG